MPAEADLLPPLIDGPPLDPDDSSERRTPLRPPSLDLIASTGASDAARVSSSMPSAASAPSWQPPASAPPAAASGPSPEFGGALLARYGNEPGRARGRTVVLVLSGLALAAVAALLLLR